VGSKVLPTTASDKKLALRHLDESIAFEKRKAAEHARAPQNAYNKAHKAEHDKGVAASQEQRKKVQKVRAKTEKKTSKQAEKTAKKTG
jgi:hypothetical protein